jgi:hypothetical protein
VETWGKEPTGGPRRRWGDNIKMDLQEVGYGGMDWIGLAQDRDNNQPSVDKFLTRKSQISHPSPNLGPTKAITLRVLEALTPMINRLFREPDHLPPSSIYCVLYCLYCLFINLHQTIFCSPSWKCG